MEKPGLYVVATPIGNLGDMTFRAVETLKESDLIACEDTRRTDTLLRHFDIKKPVIRYDEHVHGKASGRILDALRQGQAVALVTDAGTPSVSDPGTRLVQAVVEAGHPVFPIPGPSALSAALSVAGFKGEQAVFLGFLPRKPGPGKRLLREAWDQGKIIVIFESPFRVLKTLEWIEETAPEARILIAREMTKIHEEYTRGDVRTIRSRLAGRTLKGEFVLVIGPS